MKKLLLFFILSCTSVFAYPYYNTYNNSYRPQIANRYAYYNYPHSYYNMHKNYGFSDIQALEKYALDRSYSRDNNLARLQRLEMQAFGAVQQGDPYTRYKNVRSALLSRPKQNYKTSVLRTLSDYFSGQLTGYTPSVDNYSLENDNFSVSPSFGQSFDTNYRTPFGRGQRTYNYGAGSSSSVRILD